MPQPLGRASSSSTKEQDHPEEYYRYELAGIVVQTGAISSGHYYSYIKTRGTFEASAGPAKWHEFNDEMVRPFDPAMIPDASFGKDGGTATSGTGAFLLVYDR